MNDIADLRRGIFLAIDGTVQGYMEKKKHIPPPLRHLAEEDNDGKEYDIHQVVQEVEAKLTEQGPGDLCQKEFEINGMIDTLSEELQREAINNEFLVAFFTRELPNNIFKPKTPGEEHEPGLKLV